MRVLYATHSSEFMGAEHSLMDMLSGLDPAKVEPLVLLGRRGPLVAKLDEQGIRHVMVPYVGDTISLSPLKPSWLKRAINDAAVPQVVRLLRRERIDLVHCNSILADVGMRAAQRADIPYVCHIRDHGKADHGIEFVDPEGVARLVAGAERVIAISDSVRQQYEPNVGSDNFVTLHNGFNTDIYRLEHGLLLATACPRILLAGRIAPGKGQLEAVKAVDMLASRGIACKLAIVGSVGNADYDAEMREYIAAHALGDVVKLKPFVDSLADDYLCSDIALMCSTCEAFGRATVEGMLAGCLVIGARAGATPEIITDGQTGLLYESGNPEDLADKVQWAIAHASTANAIALEGQRYAADEFNNQAYARKLETMYDEILTPPVFSVIMPSYKLERSYMERAIASVLAQKFENWELVYVDDNPAGSPWKDVSRQLAAEHAGDPRMTFIFHEDNLGANPARNDAIAAASGEWLAFLDADDYWDACYLRNVAEKIAGVCCAAVGGAATGGSAGADHASSLADCALVSTPVRFYNGRGTREVLFSHADGMVYEEEILGDIFSSSSGICVRHDALLEAGGFDSNLPARQDYDMWLRVCKRHPVAFCDEVAVTVVQDGHESISTSYERHLSGTLAVLEKILVDGDLSTEQRTAVAESHYLYLGRFLIKRGQGRLAREYLSRARAAGAGAGKTAKLQLASYAAPAVPYVRRAVNRVRYR